MACCNCMGGPNCCLVRNNADKKIEALEVALESFDPKTLANGKRCWCLQWPDVKPEDWSCTNEAWCAGLEAALGE